jgi:hypothetical protein
VAPGLAEVGSNAELVLSNADFKQRSKSGWMRPHCNSPNVKNRVGTIKRS